MKNIVTFLISLLLTTNLLAQTTVSGDQTGIWAKANSPYLVEGDITVPSNQVLTIEPGVTVQFQANYKFHVLGQLLAGGAETDTIYFTAADQTLGWGGIRMENTSVLSTLSYCKFEDGKTVSNEFPDQHGGGLMLDHSDCRVDHCVFENNQAIGDENGMGGAIYGLNTTQKTHITNCIFRNNSTYAEGGAIKLSADSGALIEKCQFYNNSVSYGGGGICVYGCVDTKIHQCLFVDNFTIYSDGGAAFVEGFSTGISFVNCTMIHNQAVNGEGGGVDVTYSDASFTNCIVYDNDGAYSDDIYLNVGGNAEVNHCNMAVPADAVGGDNINVDAGFVDAAGGDYHLAEGSPCIDSGIDSLTITDAYGNVYTPVDLDSMDYVGSAPDMGCFEYAEPMAVSTGWVADYAVFPNPTSGVFVIDQAKANDVVLISDLAGKVLWNQSLRSSREQIDISDWADGFYVLSVRSGQAVFTAKIVKE